MPTPLTLGDLLAQGQEMRDQGLTQQEAYERLLERFMNPEASPPPRPKLLPMIARTFARRPHGRTPRRASVARRSRRTAARGTPSRPGDEPPRLTRLLYALVSLWLGLGAYQRRLDDLDRETLRRLRGGA